LFRLLHRRKEEETEGALLQQQWEEIVDAVISSVYSVLFFMRIGKIGVFDQSCETGDTYEVDEILVFRILCIPMTNIIHFLIYLQKLYKYIK
jgi:hypothetical protein